MRVAHVAVPVPGLDLLTYRVPDHLDLPRPGARALVPLGQRTLTGCVVRTEEACLPAGEQAESGVKDLVEILDDEPFLPESIVELCAWMADYYLCGPGEALAAAMPPFAWVQSERLVEITEEGARCLSRRRGEAENLLGGEARSGLREIVLERLRTGTPLALKTLARQLPGASKTAPPDAALLASVRAAVQALERQGLVRISTVMQGSARAFKTHAVVSLTMAGQEVAAQVASGEASAAVIRGARQREALAVLATVPAGLPASTLRDRRVSSETVRRLMERGLVAIRREAIDRDPFEAGAGRPGVDPAAGMAPPGSAERVLTSEQAAALARLSALRCEGGFKAALLHGVTGSGKTEIYLRLAADARRAGRGVLVLVPEIALTPALSAVFRGAFGDEVGIQHSGMSDGERHDQWHRIRRGEVSVVVGTRSAVFAPLASPGLVIVDEEHDASYKQEESPRYHGRDVAVMRAKQQGLLVVLGSATPSAETYHHARSGRYELVTLSRRVFDRPLADVSIVNMRDEYALAGSEVVFSQRLREAIEVRLARGEQVLVLLNRRGFASSVLCRQCGNTIECPNCSVSLTLHHGRADRRARCHYCNHTAVVPKVCPRCAAPYLEHVGVGTQRIEEEARAAFPAARIARLDRDVVRRRGAVAELLGRFGAGEIDLLIGTQMIAKGHDFPRVTLVGVISADVGLGLADFRAAERTFQLLTQVVGRAGRGEQPGQAIVQTLFPEHYSIQHACRQDYAAFSAEELVFRRAMHYPPVMALVNVLVRGRSLPAAFEDANDLTSRLRAAAGNGRFRVLGPAPAPLVKMRGEHRVQFFLKGVNRAAMRAALRDALAARPDLRRRAAVDVDPVSML